MSLLLVCLVTFLASALTFFSGFGLGTLLLPVFALFVPLEIAVAATAVVHLVNNIFKAFLVGRCADYKLLALFGVPAALAAFAGAWLLTLSADLPALAQYSLGGHRFHITPVKLLVAILIAAFAVLELSPRFKRWSVSPRWVPLGGVLSGFFGGLSGHQGALRSAFLLRLGLEKSVFIATVVLASVMVDVSRLMVYGVTFLSRDVGLLLQRGELTLVLAGCVSALLGALLGYRFLQKVDMGFIHALIGGLLVVYAVLLGSGLI